MIALAGGFTKNANLAKLILVYYPTLDKWNQNAKLLEKRISPSSCFTKENYYVFGGMIESDDDDVKYSSKIESFKGRSLRNMDGAIGIVVVVNKTPEFLKFIARADALAFHL